MRISSLNPNHLRFFFDVFTDNGSTVLLLDRFKNPPHFFRSLDSFSPKPHTFEHIRSNKHPAYLLLRKSVQEILHVLFRVLSGASAEDQLAQNPILTSDRVKVIKRGN